MPSFVWGECNDRCLRVVYTTPVSVPFALFLDTVIPAACLCHRMVAFIASYFHVCSRKLLGRTNGHTSIRPAGEVLEEYCSKAPCEKKLGIDKSLSVYLSSGALWRGSLNQFLKKAQKESVARGEGGKNAVVEIAKTGGQVHRLRYKYEFHPGDDEEAGGNEENGGGPSKAGPPPRVFEREERPLNGCDETMETAAMMSSTNPALNSIYPPIPTGASG